MLYYQLPYALLPQPRFQAHSPALQSSSGAVFGLTYSWYRHEAELFFTFLVATVSPSALRYIHNLKKRAYPWIDLVG